jgi:Flp pilus assembly protein TadD
MDIDNAVKSAFETYQAGDLQQAVNICQEIARIHPNNIFAVNLLGIISYQLSRRYS